MLEKVIFLLASIILFVLLVRPDHFSFWRLLDFLTSFLDGLVQNLLSLF